MNIRIEYFKTSNAKLFKEACKIRHMVFVKEQSVPQELEFDGKDDESEQFIAIIDNLFVGTARYRHTIKGIKLERFAVSTDFRNKKVGQAILDTVLSHIGKTSKKIYLHSQDNAVNFYKRNNFDIVGESFTEAGIIHYLMVLKQQI